jgi:nucleoprotein TPR
VEAHFDKELNTAKRLGELYKKQAEGRGNKTTQLEGVVQALRDHLAEVKAEASTTLEQEKRKCEAADKSLADAKSKLDRTLAAAAGNTNGSALAVGNENALPAPTLAFEDGGPAAASGRAAGALLSMQLPDASAAALRRENLTMTELYTKYAEAADAWRKECGERRRLQATIDGMISELEQRAPFLTEQRAEYERAVAAHGEMRLRLEDATVELRRMEAEARGHNADKRHHARTTQGLEAQSADLSRQVQLLLHEVTELKGGASMAPPPQQLTGGMDAAAVIASRLVDFRDIGELQEQNRSQLAIIRKLSADQEDMGSNLKAEYQAQVEKIQSEAQRALDELEARKGKTQTLVEAIVRQRDMYKALYASSSGPGGAANADAAALSLAASASASLAMASPAAATMMQLGDGGYGGGSAAQLAALNAELQADLAKHKEESAANADLLRKQADEHRGAAAAAKAEASAANAHAEFERSRYNSLAESAAAARRDVEQLVDKNATASRQVAAHEAAVREQAARLDAAEDRASAAESAARRAESERSLLAAAEQRAAHSCAAAMAEKAKLEAGRDAAFAMKAAKEEEVGRERERLAGEVARLQREWATARTELDTERERTRGAATAAAAAAEKTAEKTGLPPAAEQA